MNERVLGLKIVRIKEGYQDLLEINGDPSWTKKVWDIRRDLPSGTNTEEGKTVLLLSGIDSGSIITIAACIEGRQNDCISAWVFVPTNIEISGKQLVDIIEETKKELVANERNDTKLRQLFERSYSACDATRTSIVSSGEKYAYRKYGRGSGYELYELLNNPDQSDYRPFKGVFLIDNTLGISCEGTELTARTLREFVKVKPVSSIHGFEAFIGNNPIDKPMFLPEGDEVTITWKRSGYKSIEKKWIVRNGQQVPGISEPDYKILVPYDIFIVRDQLTGESIKHHRVKVNNSVITEGYQLPVSEAMASNCPVTVEADGYSPKSKVCNLSSEQLYFTLEKEIISYDFKIELLYDDNRYADLHVETNVKLNGRSPIEGYHRYPHNDSYLYYKPFGKKQKLFAGLTLLVALLLGVCGGLYLASLLKKPQTQDQGIVTSYGTAGNQPGKDANLNKPENNGSVMSKVTDYLDNHEKWNRNEMERFPEISGLWDDINNRDFERILIHEEQLKASSKFKELVQAVKDNQNKSFPQAYITSPNDVDITIGNRDTKNSYIQRLYNAPETGAQAGAQTGGQHSAGHHSSGQNKNNPTNNNNDQDLWK